uniref:Crp/Fnr family transcriptional regulator n=1 Tax=Oscillatoriales cyanobacterium SpSt-402 TaxID=2282168 RepID=A0A832H4V5_9CYAN
MVLTSEKIYGKSMPIVSSSNSFLHSRQANHHIFQRRELIPSDSGLFWQISKGIVRVSTLDDDGIFISLGYWGAGDIVGRFLSGSIPYQIECLTVVETIALPSFASCPTSALLTHIQQKEEFLQLIQQRSIRKRLICFVTWLFDRFGQDTQNGKQLNLHLTHQEIAEAIGTTRVTVTRLIKELQQDGYLCWSKQNHLLLKHVV